MRQLNLVVQTSLDGFVAGINGEFDHFIGGEENLEFVCSIIEDADAILLGRITYEMLNSYWPTASDLPDATKNIIKYSNWYNAVSKNILSRSLPADSTGVLIINDNLPGEINKLKQQSGKNIFIFGSPTAVHSLLDLQVIDNIWLIVHPVIFGQGIPLFRDGKKVINFDLLHSKQLFNGTLCNKYGFK